MTRLWTKKHRLLLFQLKRVSISGWSCCSGQCNSGWWRTSRWSRIWGYWAHARSCWLQLFKKKWSLTVRAVNQEEQDPVPVAKEVVAYLEEAMLPAPEVGQITIDMGKNDHTATTVVWQQEKMLRTVQHQDARSALEMAVQWINKFQIRTLPLWSSVEGRFRAMILRKTGGARKRLEFATLLC